MYDKTDTITTNTTNGGGWSVEPWECRNESDSDSRPHEVAFLEGHMPHIYMPGFTPCSNDKVKV